MSYFNYHAKAKKLIKTGHLVGFEFVNKHNKISPAMVLFFDDEIPMPIREEKFDEYIEYIQSYYQIKEQIIDNYVCINYENLKEFLKQP